MRMSSCSIARTLTLAVLVLGCQSAPSPGAPCTRDGDCASSLVCRFGRCRSGCAENRDCPAGAACFLSDQGGACAVDADLGCETGVGRTCASGLVCVADRCEATCVGNGDCPDDGLCVTTSGVSFCARASDVDAGSPGADAGDAGAAAGCQSAPRVCLTDDARGCALVDGAVFCWGNDSGERLGDGATGSRVGGSCSDCPGTSVPVPVVYDGTTTPLTGMTALACGGSHACAIDAGGMLFCWGDDGHAQLGTGSSGAPTGAVRAAVFGRPVDMIALGGSHTCARDREMHTLACTGENVSGQIDPSQSYVMPRADPLHPIHGASMTPIGVGRVIALAAGGTWTCASTEPDGELHCWGWNEQGQTSGDGPGASIDPGIIAAATGVTGVAVGYQTTCFVAESAVRCMGSDIGGSLGDAHGLVDCTPGDGDDSVCTSTPTEPQPGLAVTEIYGGSAPNGFCLVGPSGPACWGANDVGQAGQASSGAIRPAVAPFVVARGGLDICTFALSSTAMCAVLEDHRVLCAGNDHQGQLGDGTADDETTGTPTFVVGIP